MTRPPLDSCAETPDLTITREFTILCEFEIWNMNLCHVYVMWFCSTNARNGHFIYDW